MTMQQDCAALFIDFDNIAPHLAPESLQNNQIPSNDNVSRLINHLHQRWALLLRRAYGNWAWRMNMSTIDGKDVKVSRYSPDALRWNAIELMQVFGANPTMRDGKNHADIAIALDAFETVLKHEHIKTVIIVSNDSDFAPLATKLHAYGCYTVGVGTHRAARFLPTSYQEFLWLEDLLDKPEPGSAHPTLQQSCATPSEKDEAGADLRMQSRRALRQAMAVLTPSKAPWMMSQLKAAIQVPCPLFDHQKLGFAKFSEWLADQSDLVTLTRVGTELQNRVMPR